MRIAILGAGFAGLATTWYLLHYSRGSITVDLYDPEPIGSGVSGLSSGLLHPYAGKHARRSWDADKSMDSTHQLLTEAARGLNQSVILSKGILRPAVTMEQRQDFEICAKEHDDVEWWSEEKCLSMIPGLQVNGGGLYVKTGLTVDVPNYLKGLWQSCALLGTQFHQTAMIKENELKNYDRVIFAIGYAAKSFKPFASLPIFPVKGQVLELRWPTEYPSLPFSLVSHGYLAMAKGQSSCIAGATFERTFKSPNPEPEVAVPEIMKKITPFFPALANAEVIGCKAGIRATSPQHNHLPLIGRSSEKFWFLTGLGSKGLLYHARAGDLLARALLRNEPKAIPKELWYPLEEVNS